jgi:hypothetical protein
MMDWCIYYDDGRTFSSVDGRFEDAPADGVICIVRKDGDRSEFVSGGDYYVRFEEDGSIIATEDIGPILRKLGWMKFGRFTSNKNHARIMARAASDWPQK